MIKKYLLGLFLAVLFVASALLIYKKLHPPKLPPNLIEGVGRFDADVINLATKYPGRITMQKAQDGMAVKQGELLTLLEDNETKAKLEAIQKERKAKEVELSILQASLPQDVKKASEAFKAAKALKQELASQIAAIKSVVAQDKKDVARLQNLFAQNLIPKQQLELTRLKLQTDRKTLQALQAKMAQVQAKVESAKSTLKQADAQLKKIESLRYAIEAIKANEQTVKATLNDMRLYAPVDGYILEKVANVGEVLPPGGVSATLFDPQSLYLKIYVDTLQNGRIKIGDKAVIFLDAYPNRAFKAKVVHIAKRAEFTPKEVAVRSDRIQRVFEVHIKPDKPNPLFKVGLPAIGVISIDGKGLPTSLNQLPEL